MAGEFLKLDESCSSNPKCQIGLAKKARELEDHDESNLRFRIPDLSSRIRPISKFLSDAFSVSIASRVFESRRRLPYLAHPRSRS